MPEKETSHAVIRQRKSDRPGSTAHDRSQAEESTHRPVQDWSARGLLGLTHLAIIEVGDTDVSIIDELAFSPLVNPLDGLRHGMAGFVLPFDYAEDHGGWFELFVTVGNDGFAFVLFVRDRDGVDPELLAVCRAHTQQLKGL